MCTMLIVMIKIKNRVILMNLQIFKLYIIIIKKTISLIEVQNKLSIFLLPHLYNVNV